MMTMEKFVGEYCADILVDDKVMVEVKATKNLTKGNEEQTRD